MNVIEGRLGVGDGCYRHELQGVYFRASPGRKLQNDAVINTTAASMEDRKREREREGKKERGEEKKKRGKKILKTPQKGQANRR